MAFQPKILVMNGICTVVEDVVNVFWIYYWRSLLGYQIGKYKGNEFKQEPYQSKIRHKIKIEIK